jgi:FMN phosphatase YigB (HAD superfamily)
MAELDTIRAILFDTEGVLYHHPRQDHYLRAFLDAYGLTPRHPAIVEKALRAARFDVLTGRIPLEMYFDAILHTHGLDDPDAMDEGRAALYQDAGDIELFPGVDAVLTALEAAGLRLGAVADSPYAAGDEIGWLAARQLSPGLWSVFVVSSRVGALKDEPLIFERALHQLGLTPDQAAFVGHNPVDLGCARDMGILTIAFMPDDPDTETDYLIPTLYGLEALFLAD